MARKLLIPASVLFALIGCNPTDYDFGRDTDTNDPPQDTGEEIIGEGPWPDIKVDPTVLSFGYLLPGCESDEKIVTISNVGDADLVIDGIDGPGAAAFDMDHDGTGETLSPGESITVELTFEADTLGDYTGALIIDSNDPDEQEVVVDLEGHGSENPFQEDIFEQPIPTGVDVLWVIDNSCSMGSVVDDLGTELDSFINNFVTLGLDYQLGVTSTDMVDTTHQGRLQGVGVMSPAILGSQAAVVTAFKDAAALGSGGSADERGRDAAYAALSSPIIDNENAGLVRTDAHLAVIVVSDEEDGSGDISTGDFVTFMDNYKGDPDLTSVSGMVGPEINGGIGIFPDFSCAFGGGGSAQSTKHYPDIINPTGGLHSDLCNMDFDEVLTWLSFYAAGMSTRFCPTDPIVNPAGLSVEVNGTPVNRVTGAPGTWTNGWNLALDGCVEFYGSSIPGPGAEIRLTYPVDGTCD